jgi:RNase H-fold protein (predicted Holliday junction resolvase)
MSITYCYAIKQTENDFIVPYAMINEFAGVSDFHKLTDSQRIQYGWYPCELETPEFDYRIQRLSQVPVCVLDTDRNVVIATYAVEDISLFELQEKRCDEIDKLHKKKLYTDVGVSFPNGIRYVQFRNEVDRNNLSNVVQAALGYIILGTPEATMKYRTQDNETQEVTAIQMVTIGFQVLGMKQNLIEVCWMHKDTIRAFETPLDVVEYNIQLGW